MQRQGPETGPLVVLVHGSMDRMAGMAKLARRLATDCSVISYDRRGYGESVAHVGPFTMEHQVADLVTLVAGRPCVLVGHSYGGNVVLATADRHPELVAAIALYETPLSWLPWWPGTTAGANALATRGRPEEAAERFMRRMIGDELWDRLPERTTSGAAGGGPGAGRRADGPAQPRTMVSEQDRVSGDGRSGRARPAASCREHGVDRRCGARRHAGHAGRLPPRRPRQRP